MNHTWEQLNSLADAHRRRQARHMLELMVAAQGDNKSWIAQRKNLVARASRPANE